MATKWCSRHLIGYNDELDPTCPQCTLASLEPAPIADTKAAAIALKNPAVL